MSKTARTFRKNLRKRMTSKGLARRNARVLRRLQARLGVKGV